MEFWMPKITEETVSAVDSAVAIGSSDNVISSTPQGEKFIIRRCEDRSRINCSRCDLAVVCKINLSK